MSDRVVRKTKTLTCGHEQTFSTPVPGVDEDVYCLSCKDYSKTLPRRSRQWKTVSEGRARRLKPNPRSNNQHTKGRALG